MSCPACLPAHLRPCLPYHACPYRPPALPACLPAFMYCLLCLLRKLPPVGCPLHTLFAVTDSGLAAVVEHFGPDKKKKGEEWQDAMLSSNLKFDLSSIPFSL